MKKWIALLLVCSFLLGVVGCTNPNEGEATTTTTTTTAATIPTETPVSDFKITALPDKGFAGIDQYTGTSDVVIIPSKYEGLPVQVIAPYAFTGAPVRSVTIPDSVISIESEAFKGCDKLEEVIGGAGIKKISAQAFRNCTKLKHFILPKSLEEIGSAAFEWTALEEITIPSGVTFRGIEQFCLNKSLKSVVIEEGVTKIDDYAVFGFCTALETVTIPGSVEMIDTNAFVGCTALKTVTFLGDAPKEVSKEVFKDSPSVTIYYKEGTAGWDDTPLKEYNLVVY